MYTSTKLLKIPPQDTAIRADKKVTRGGTPLDGSTFKNRDTTYSIVGYRQKWQNRWTLKLGRHDKRGIPAHGSTQNWKNTAQSKRAIRKNYEKA
jgi:hypothetical protein